MNAAVTKTTLCQTNLSKMLQPAFSMEIKKSANIIVISILTIASK